MTSATRKDGQWEGWADGRADPGPSAGARWKISDASKGMLEQVRRAARDTRDRDAADERWRPIRGPTAS